jgi:hypothetical protein
LEVRPLLEIAYFGVEKMAEGQARLPAALRALPAAEPERDHWLWPGVRVVCSKSIAPEGTSGESRVGGSPGGGRGRGALRYAGCRGGGG